MRIGFLYPAPMMREPVDAGCVWTSARGLTGSELACVMYAVHLSRLGHGVTLFMNFVRPGDIEGVTCCPYQEWESVYRHQRWDALCSWMTPEPLKHAPDGSFRLFNQQVSDFNLCEPGWESYVDVLAPLSHSHARHMDPMTSLSRDKWRIMYNGVDVSLFQPGPKSPGKIVWASSHDRGLHWLLELFPKLKREVPRAELHVFYDFQGAQRFASMSDATGLMAELGHRSRYVLECLRRLRGHGVFAHGSVSRERIRSEMASAEILAYPCDPVHYTETFGVTVLEACAAGTVPVLCAADAFGELWGPVSPAVEPPFQDHKDEYARLLASVLSDHSLRAESSSRCVRHAARFDWSSLSKGLEECLVSRGRTGLPLVDWGSP